MTNIQQSTSALPASQRGWRLAEWSLATIWIAAALYDMYPRLPGGSVLVGSFLTTHAADLTLPGWLYIVLRRRPSRVPLGGLFSRSRETAALSIVIGSCVTELSQIVWPDGAFRGVFDSLDLLAYVVGVAACYAADRRWAIAPERVPARRTDESPPGTKP